MDIAALLTSAGINISITILLFSLYSILRKQPSNVSVYFGRRLASMRERQLDTFSLERFVPSPSWILKAWETTEDELLYLGGMDAVVLVRIVVFSIRIFCIAAVSCILLVLPVNYHGQDMAHKRIPSESLEVFTIANVKQGSQWLWAHCLALYVISFSACALLYFEYKSITRTRRAHISGSPPNPCHFTVLVRAVPWSSEKSYSESVKEYFMNYYASSYLSHQIVHHSSIVHKLMNDAGKMCGAFKNTSADQTSKLSFLPCLCGVPNSFEILSNEADNNRENIGLGVQNLAREKEYAVAFVSFKTRYAALVAAEVLQSPNPMLWVTESAPEPNDVLWSNLCIQYRQLWIRKIATLVGAIAIMLVFLLPVSVVQGLTHLDKLSRALPFLKGLLNSKKFVNHVVTGYLPSVILILFMYAIPPTMMLFSTVEGSVSHSGRKKSACIKVLYFTIWNVFFANVLSGSVIAQLHDSKVQDIPKQLAAAVPMQSSFFMTYVLTSGWASLSVEMMQPLGLLYNVMKKFVCRIKEDPPNGTLSFPYHTEVPKLLLFGLLGFTCSVMVPLVLPFLLIYFVLAYLVYKNQIINVYTANYESGGQYWPIAHNTTIASLVLMQIIAVAVFGIKRSSIASGFTIPLIISTILFNEYCRQRFFPTFKKISGQVLMEMDRQDEQSGRMAEIHQQLLSAYCQLRLISRERCNAGQTDHHRDQDNTVDPEAMKPEKEAASR